MDLAVPHPGRRGSVSERNGPVGIALNPSSKALQQYVLDPSFKLRDESRIHICMIGEFHMTSIHDAFFWGFTNIVKLGLNGNDLQEIPGVEQWFRLPNLRVLYLHDNYISSLLHVKDSLRSLRKLTYLTMYNNPVALHPLYRPALVNSLPSLQALDGYVISHEEYEMVHKIKTAGGGEAPKHILTPEYRIPRPSERVEKTIRPPAEFRIMDQELALINDVFSSHSPIVRLQRVWRGFRQRSMFERYKEKLGKAAVDIQRIYRGFVDRKDQPFSVVKAGRAVRLIQRVFRKHRGERLANLHALDEYKINRFLCLEKDAPRVTALLHWAIHVVFGEGKRTGEIDRGGSAMGQYDQGLMKTSPLRERASPIHASGSQASPTDGLLGTSNLESYEDDINSPSTIKHVLKDDFRGRGDLSGRRGSVPRSARRKSSGGGPPTSRSYHSTELMTQEAIEEARRQRLMMVGGRSSFFSKTSDVFIIRPATDVEATGFRAHVFASPVFVCRKLLSLKPFEDSLADVRMRLPYDDQKRLLNSKLRFPVGVGEYMLDAYTQIMLDEYDNEAFRDFLKEFEVPDVYLLATFLQLVRKFNVGDVHLPRGFLAQEALEEPLPLYNTYVVYGVSSAVAIQSAFRAHLCRKSLEPRLGERVIRRRAAVAIQSMFRRRMAWHRSRVMKECIGLIRRLRESRHLFVDLSVFNDLKKKALERDCSYFRPQTCHVLFGQDFKFGFSPNSWFIVLEEIGLAHWLRAWLPVREGDEMLNPIIEYPDDRSVYWALRWGAVKISSKEYAGFIHDSMQESVARAIWLTICTYDIREKKSKLELHSDVKLLTDISLIRIQRLWRKVFRMLMGYKNEPPPEKPRPLIKLNLPHLRAHQMTMEKAKEIIPDIIESSRVHPTMQAAISSRTLEKGDAISQWEKEDGVGTEMGFKSRFIKRKRKLPGDRGRHSPGSSFSMGSSSSRKSPELLNEIHDAEFAMEGRAASAFELGDDIDFTREKVVAGQVGREEREIVRQEKMARAATSLEKSKDRVKKLRAEKGNRRDVPEDSAFKKKVLKLHRDDVETRTEGEEEEENFPQENGEMKKETCSSGVISKGKASASISTDLRPLESQDVIRRREESRMQKVLARREMEKMAQKMREKEREAEAFRCRRRVLSSRMQLESAHGMRDDEAASRRVEIRKRIAKEKKRIQKSKSARECSLGFASASNMVSRQLTAGSKMRKRYMDVERSKMRVQQIRAEAEHRKQLLKEKQDVEFNLRRLQASRELDAMRSVREELRSVYDSFTQNAKMKVVRPVVEEMVGRISRMGEFETADIAFPDISRSRPSSAGSLLPSRGASRLSTHGTHRDADVVSRRVGQGNGSEEEEEEEEEEDERVGDGDGGEKLDATMDISVSASAPHWPVQKEERKTVIHPVELKADDRLIPELLPSVHRPRPARLPSPSPAKRRTRSRMDSSLLVSPFLAPGDDERDLYDRRQLTTADLSQGLDSWGPL